MKTAEKILTFYQGRWEIGLEPKNHREMVLLAMEEYAEQFKKKTKNKRNKRSKH